MTFGSFIQIYTEDMKNGLKENTWLTKENIIHTKFLPYFEIRKICEILPKDIIAWQNEMILHTDICRIWNYRLKKAGPLEYGGSGICGIFGNTARRLFLDGKPNSYLVDLNEQAEDMFFRLVKEFAEDDGITEKLKAENQILWVQRMNAARTMATEIVNNELIYA